MNGISIYKSRLAMGEALASQVLKAFGSDLDIDVVIPVCLFKLIIFFSFRV